MGLGGSAGGARAAGGNGRGADERVDGILRALLLGERTGLTQQTRQDFQRTGAYHALVISGLHVGAALPVMRAAWMCSAYLVSGLVCRQRRALNVIAGTALVFLLIEPGLLFDASFQMSFLAVALIAGIAVPLLEMTVEPYRRALIDLWNYDRDLHLETKTAEIRVALPLGLLSLLTNWTLLGRLTWCCTQAISWTVGWVATERPVDMRVPPPLLWLGVLFGLSLVCVWLSFDRGRAWRASAWAGFALSLALLVAHPFPPRLTAGRLEFTAIDVGQGESLFLALPDGRTVLVDGGGLPDFGGSRAQTLDIGDAVVSPYLWSRSIRRLDVLAITHSDMDHFGGVPALLDNFQIGEVWLSPIAFGEEDRNRLDAITARGIRVKFLKQGDRFQMGAVAFHILGPAVGAESEKGRNNDRSLVLTASFGDHCFLLTGDIEARAETRLVDGEALREADILKVAHHGSKTSTQDVFLDRVAPTFAMISAGFRNPFGHPHPTVLERLQARGVQVLRTDLEGTVSVSTDGQRL